MSDEREAPPAPPDQPEPESHAAVRYRYDRADLEAMVGFSFTDRELATVALEWGVHLDPGKSAAQGARKLVHTLEQEGRLHGFVERLRRDKPLVEWPQGEPIDEGPPTVAEAAEDAPPTDESVGVIPPPDDLPGEASSPAAASVAVDAPSSLTDPYVDQLMQEQESEDVSLRDKQVWRRAVLLAGVLIVGVGAGAVGMYVAFRPDEPVAEVPTVPTSVAVAAADLVEQSVENLREACEVEEEPDSARSSLTASFRKCAVPEIVGRGRVNLPPPPPPDPVPSRPRMRLPGRKPDPQPSRAAGCMDRCHQVHNSCKQSECGQEPTSAADYPKYQRCLAGCQSKYSRCRLSCR